MNGLHLESRGQGPLLLLVHGWAMHGGIFAPLVEALAGSFRVLSVDLPGHGRSRASTLPLQVERLADALADLLAAHEPAPGAAPAWIVGWSLGGLIALALAARHPQRVRGLVMLAASPRFVAATDWPMGMDPAVFAAFGTELDRDFAGTLDRFLMLEAQGSSPLRETLRFLRDAVHERGGPTPEALHAGLALLRSTDLRPLLPGLAVPSLWLAGRRDRLVGPEAMQAAAALAPNSRLQVFEHAGHAPFLTEPAAVAAAITAFAAEGPP